MSKTIKKYVLQRKILRIEISRKDLPKDFKPFYEKPLSNGKIITSNKFDESKSIEEIRKAYRYTDQSKKIDDIKEGIELINKIRLDKEFHEYFRAVNENPDATSTNIIESFYRALPEKILDLTSYPIQVGFFHSILTNLKNTQEFFSEKNIKSNRVKDFSETFLDALNELNIHLKAFNFLNLNFSVIPNERFSKLLALTSHECNNNNKSSVIENIYKMIEYKRKEKLEEFIKIVKPPREVLQEVMKLADIPPSYKKLLISQLNIGK
jgi:hypothetical protein